MASSSSAVPPATVAAGCRHDEMRCERGRPQHCTGGSWQDAAPCAEARYCHAGACVAAVAVSPTGRYALLQSGGVLTWKQREGVPVAGSARTIAGIDHASAFVSPQCVETTAAAPGGKDDHAAAPQRNGDKDRSEAKAHAAQKSGTVQCIQDDKLSADTKPPWTHKEVPPEVAGALSYTGSEYYGCAVMPDRRVMCWGSNRDGGVGIGVVDSVSAEPRPAGYVLGLDDVDKVVTGSMHACALRRIGRVVCWGSDECGNLGGPGVRASVSRAKPGRPLIIQDKVLDVVVAEMAGRGLARTAKGLVYRWGRDCIGIRQVYTRASPPRALPELQGARSLGIGLYGGAAITKDGRLIQWVGDAEGRVVKQYDVN